MAVNLTTLFTRLGHGFYVQEVANLARLTTIPVPVKAYQDHFDSTSLPLKKAMAPVEAANRGFQSSASGLVSTLRDSMAETLIEMYQADANLDRKDLTTALVTLIRQMAGSGDDVDASTVAASAGTIVGTGDGVLVASAKRADGKFNENLLAETIRITCTGDTTPAKASFTAKGDVAVADKLSQDWPLGSACSRGLTATSGNDNLLSNGDFDDWTQTNVPDYWTPSVATVGTTLKSTTYEVQSLVVSGPPTAGTYVLTFTDTTGRVRSTPALAYNATAATLQTELRKFPGLELLTVTSSGTTPNFTHTITFTGYAGKPPRLRTTNNTTGGTYTHSTTTQGSTVAEVQTVAMSGTPTGGTYTITYANAAGISQTTAAIAYNANSATVQTALRLLNELEEITIVESGSTPNYTHTITFTGIGGNVTQLTSSGASLTGGTPVITHATTVPGIQLSFLARAVEFDSDGSQLTTLNQKVTLKALTQYAFNLWMMADVVPAAGVITVDLVDGIGGTVLADEAGTNNTFTITCSGLTTSFVAKNGVFRTPKIMPTAVYLRIRISTAVTTGSSIFFDHAALVEMSELYKGGPSASIFSGKTAMRKAAADGQVDADYFILTTTNDRAGEFQEWFERNFNMREKGLLLPSDTGGAETISDALVA